MSQFLLKGAQSVFEQYILPRLRASRSTQRGAGGRRQPERADPTSKTERG